MSTSNDVGGGCLLEATHRIQALFQMSMVALDAVVEVLRCPMPNVGQDGAESSRIALGLVGCDPLRPHACLIDGTREERLGSLSVPPLREVGVNDLPVFVDGTLDVGPRPVQTRVRFINAPPRADWPSVHTCSCAKHRQEALDPAIDGAAVNVEAPLGEPLDDVGIAQAVPDVPTHSQGDDIIGEDMVREGARGTRGEPASTRIAAPALSA